MNAENSISQLFRSVRAKIKALRISEVDAARAIGVTPGSLSKHLAGEYARSDSLAKYRTWLARPSTDSLSPPRAVVVTRADEIPTSSADSLEGPSSIPTDPHRVVDIFSGCGGLSLGFELAGNGQLFRTVLAIDVEEAMVKVFNANHPSHAPGSSIGQLADLSEFLNEAEVLAFYLDHLSRVEENELLKQELANLKPLSISGLRSQIQTCDLLFLRRLEGARKKSAYVEAYAALPKSSLSQTSVSGFHSALKLPPPGTGRPIFPSALWGANNEIEESPPLLEIPAGVLKLCKAEARQKWNEELLKLRERADGAGSGQLASAARKISESLQLIDSSAYSETKRAWEDWFSQRKALRQCYFENAKLLQDLRNIYSRGHQVQVLLGGPPCQGFSRIGRGKIRSLREQSVHVQSDSKSGDKRNQLMLQYVLFVAALQPSVFLFENVRHFQAEVKTAEGTFKATDVLAESIATISQDGLDYCVGSRILFATQHLVPQTRERYFMLGVRQDIAARAARSDLAEWCLSLAKRSPVLLKSALEGLPEPYYASANAFRSGGTESIVNITDSYAYGIDPASEFRKWIRQAPPIDRGRLSHTDIDSHCTRDSRPDDKAFFQLLGPGKRWMDYRCDDNPLVGKLLELTNWALKSAAQGHKPAGLSVAEIRELRESLDGSLSLRLLLDNIPLSPGEDKHHLSAPNYLRKREGSHGDWLARLDLEAPSKTMVSHMGKDAYAYVHPAAPRTISVREAARIQSFPDWFSFANVGLVDAYRVVGNAVPPLLSAQLATRISVVLGESHGHEERSAAKKQSEGTQQPAKVLLSLV